MSHLKSAAGLLALVGVGSAAGSANALTTAPFSLAANSPAGNVGIGSGAAQYTYGKAGSDYGVFTALNGAKIGSFASTPGLSTLDTYTADGVLSITNNCTGGCALLDTADPYLHLRFVEDGVPTLGYATFSAAGTLTSVSYEAVPEPAAWSLLFGGVGLTGAALRRKRREAMLAAAA